MKQSIPEFYRGQKILVTGATGFMGKVLVEKILRSCPDIERIYLIIRNKKGKSLDERWKEVTDKPLFDKLKILRPDALKKVSLISGDISKEELGLSGNDKNELQENVTIIFHAAADVQFNDNINDAILQNVKGTKSILDLARTMKRLKAFVHVSTTYSNFVLPTPQSVEKIIPSFHDWRTLLKLQETDPNALLVLKDKLLCGHVNPYTWSKSLAEQIVNEYSEYFPSVVMRPSVVMGCLREDPIVGWADALNAFSACTIVVFLGVLQVIPMPGDGFIDAIPVDIATRAIIISAKKAVDRNERLAVYNCGTAKLEKFTLAYLDETAKWMQDEYPVKERLWVMNPIHITNRYLFSICFFIWQVLPFYFLDIILELTGNKKMLIKIAKKLVFALDVATKFINGKCDFASDNFVGLEGCLDENDKAEFSIDTSEISVNKREVTVKQTIGILKYALKFDVSSEAMDRNRKHLKRIKIAKRAVDITKYLTLCWLSWFSLTYLIY